MVRKFRVRVNNKNYDVEVEELTSSTKTQAQQPTAVRRQEEIIPPPPVKTVEKKPVQKTKPTITTNEGETVIESPMAGLIVEVKTSVGAHVKRGDVLLILEAMKMENNILSSKDGIVKSINVSKGQEVEVGAPLIIIE